MKKLFAGFLAILMIISFCACTKKGDTDSSDPWAQAVVTEDTECGKGEKTVTVKVIVNENSVVYTVKTDSETLGEALLDNGIADGDQGEYGLYIKVVNGITADYDVNGAYWSLTKGGVMLNNGADLQRIADGEEYELTYTK